MSLNQEQIKAMRKRKAIEQDAKRKLLQITGLEIPEASGIYILSRTDENGFKYAYIGQAKKVLTRLAQHLTQHQQHIDNSLYKRGIYSETNKYGWDIRYKLCDIDNLDNEEKSIISYYANLGYQLYNVTGGGQGAGKFDIGIRKPTKTYMDGIKQGKKIIIRDIRKWFANSLDYSIKGKSNKNKEKTLEKFTALLIEEQEQDDSE